MTALVIIFVAIATIFVYKTARQNGHNAVLWTFLTIVAFLGTQFLAGLVLGIVLILGAAAQIFPENGTNAISAVFSIIALIASIGSVVLILNRVNRIKEGETPEVPPPPDFNQSK